MLACAYNWLRTIKAQRTPNILGSLPGKENSPEQVAQTDLKQDGPNVEITDPGGCVEAGNHSEENNTSRRRQIE